MNNKDFLFATFNFLLDQAAAVWPTPKATQSYRLMGLITSSANRQNTNNSDLLHHSPGTLQNTVLLPELTVPVELDVILQRVAGVRVQGP